MKYHFLHWKITNTIQQLLHLKTSFISFAVEKSRFIEIFWLFYISKITSLKFVILGRIRGSELDPLEALLIFFKSLQIKSY